MEPRMGGFMSEFVKWPSVEGFHNIYRHKAKLLTGSEVIGYRAKVKLHGTNAAIRIDWDGTVTAQKRSSDITPEADNFGFAAWVEETKEHWANRSGTETMVVFGEWAGPGVQKLVAVSKMDRCRFFVFAVYLPGSDRLISEPNEIAMCIEQLRVWRAALTRDTQDLTNELAFEVLPWFGGEYRIDFADEIGVRMTVERINADVSAIDACDPYIKESYGIEGPGEGLVFFPESGCTLERFVTTAFKAKGASHKVVKDSAPAKINTWATGSHREFVEQFVTENRLQQGLQEACGGIASMKGAGDFLKWIGGDVKKESVAELEASGLDWKDIAKMVNLVAVTWFKKRANAGFMAAANENTSEERAA